MIPLAAVLEWKLGQTYFDARCRTAEVGREMVITRWDADAADRAEPTDQEIADWAAEWEAATPAWWQRRKDAYREKIAQYKGIPDASHEDVIGFVIDAQVKAQVAGDTTELLEIATLVAQVKADIPKP